ncbi:hypothetical protein QTJ16_002818 [Diplocarpon rosae]|uniref:Uncharacterized protein n=1 Tax=Diplocarpon rosae TaxID=946125 RepID=A0AAD9WDZ8_9HELO|nr:hypothetical protein QTJ16_002818 [Diplocarpon rosae]
MWNSTIFWFTMAKATSASREFNLETVVAFISKNLRFPKEPVVGLFQNGVSSTFFYSSYTEQKYATASNIANEKDEISVILPVALPSHPWVFEKFRRLLFSLW